MTLPLFYVSPGDIDVGANRVVLSGGEARHITLSLRAKPDDSVLVADGRGNVYEVRLAVIGPEMVTGIIESRRQIEPELPCIVLYQAVARITKMDETVARAAESGISAVVPFISPRSPTGSTTKALQRLKRWNRIAWEASKVARRAVPLEVRELMEWPIEKKAFEEQELNVLLWEDESSTGLRDALPEEPPRTIGLMVGPEGGFKSREVDQLAKNGAIPVTVGDLVLRTETAGSYAAMMVRYNYHLLEPLEV
jgi:16S rRNA (uracil1498-N3)-methyltransferase